MTQKPAKKPDKSSTKHARFTDEERTAMQEHAQEFEAARRGSRAGKADGEGDGEGEVLAKIAAMAEPDRALSERLHAIITANAPDLAPRLWYGMPAYGRDSNVVCFIQNAGKFKTRYTTIGFSDKAKLDDGAMWPTAFALTKLTAAYEAKIGELVKKAVS